MFSSGFQFAGSVSPVDDMVEMASPDREDVTIARDSEPTDSIHSNCSDRDNGYSHQISTTSGMDQLSRTPVQLTVTTNFKEFIVTNTYANKTRPGK